LEALIGFLDLAAALRAACNKLAEVTGAIGVDLTGAAGLAGLVR
jgi:hypothetical protein